MATVSDPLDVRVSLIRRRLAEIDPRFVAPAEEHPYAEAVKKGKAAAEELIAIAESQDSEAPAKLRALEALGTVLATHGADDAMAARLGSLGAGEDCFPEIRAEATRALIRSGHEKFIEAFQARLASEDPNAAAAAAHAMGVAKRQAAVPALIELLAKSLWPEAQNAAAWALGEIGDPQGVQILEAGIKAGEVGAAAVEALGKLGSPDQIPLLTIALRDDLAETRTAAAEALARIIRRHPGVDFTGLRPYLTAALAAEDDPVIGVIIVSCLTRVGAEVPTEFIEHVLGINFGDESVKSYLKGLLTTAES